MKNKTLKKMMAFSLATFMAFSAVGCGNEDVTNTPATDATSESVAETVEETPLYNVGTLPIVNEPVTIKILTQDVTGRPFTKASDAGIWEWLEEQTGINIEVESYSAEELKAKMPLIMATPNDMPDIFFRCDLTEADVMNYGQNGQLLTLDSYIEEYGVNIQECFETLDYGYGASVSADGHIYALPAFNGSKTLLNYSMNKEWLAAIGKEAPATLEELYEVFKVIQASDANENGDPTDEICLSGDAKTFKRIMLSMVGINCYWPWEGCLFDAKDDKVFFVETTDEYKYMLQWLNKCYEEGMLDNEIFTQDSAQLKAKKEANKVFMYNGYMDPSKTPITGCMIPTPLTSKVNDTPLVSASAPYQVAIGAIAGNTEYPEVCMLLLDYLFSEEGSKAAYWGLEGVDYNVTDAANFVIESLGTAEGYTNAHNYKTAMIMPYWNRDEWIQPANTQLGLEAETVMGPYAQVAFQNYLHFTNEEAEQINVIAADLGLYLDDHYVGFITGTYDIEKDWDEYVKKCQAMGADELTKIYQVAYNRYYGIE